VAARDDFITVGSVENTQGTNGPARFGPLPARTTRSGRPLSPSRSHLLETLEAQSEPTTLAALVSTTGLHANTVREHLEALERRGLVRRHRAQPSGRGRPAWLYTATTAEPEHSEYAGLAAALAAAIHRTSANPREDAIAAGEDWGHDLARQHGRPGRRGAGAARRQVVSMLDDLGFGPEPDRSHGRVRLTRCPLLEAAHKHPDVVCAVHLGLVRGALEEYDAEPAGVRLVPFAEPGACRLGMHRPEEEDR
jgi:predicted ArsR family transcriptional regulator